jgi:hypothetical protein
MSNAASHVAPIAGKTAVDGVPVGQPARTSVAHWNMRVERGPDWLFVRLESDPAGVGGSLCDTIWDMLRSNRSNRVVVELDSVKSLDEPLIGEISKLGSRVQKAGGLIRVSGLSAENLSKLHACRSAAHVPHFPSRTEAVVAGWPGHPR